MLRIDSVWPILCAVSDNVQIKSWARRPTVAWAVRIVLFLAPFLGGWAAIKLAEPLFVDPAGRFRIGAWIVQAIAVSAVASLATSRALRHLTPLPALLNMTLVFPDHAPSRFKVALRSGTTRKLLADRDLSLSPNAQEAAEQALVLVDQLAKHERLTRGHTERVRAYADLIGQEFGLGERELNLLRWATLLHDVGKLKVPAEILSKPGAPTADEWAILRQHPTEAIAMLAPLEPWLGEWALAASEHHERWDGTGYPNGLSGMNISLAGRITAVADAYDVITSRRSYKTPLSIEEARQELVASAGTHFDPTVVRAMLEVGLNKRDRVNPLGWLFELPSVSRVFEVGIGTPLAVAAAVVAVAFPSSDPRPPDLAFAEPLTTTTTQAQAPEFSSTSEQLESTTTTSAVSTTAGAFTTTVSIASSVAPTTTETTTAAPTTASPTTTATTTAAPTTAAPTTAAPTTTTPPTPCEQAQSGQTNLPNVNLADCDLSGLTFDGVNFDGATLTNVDLSNVTVQNFTIIGANLNGVNLAGANFNRRVVCEFLARRGGRKRTSSRTRQPRAQRVERGRPR